MARRPGLPDYLQEGFILPYNKKEAARFHTLAAITAATFAAWLTWGYQLLSITAILAGCSAYYLLPLHREEAKARRKPVWTVHRRFRAHRLARDRRHQSRHLLDPNARDGRASHQAETAGHSALLVDWRRLPIWRLLMRLPWTMGYDNIVRIDLQPFAPPPDEIIRTMQRMWRYYR